MNPTRVMVVDDNEMFIEMSKFVLSAAAYAVETACDAEQALAQIPVFLRISVIVDARFSLIVDG